MSDINEQTHTHINCIVLDENAPAIKGHYCHAVELPNGMIYISGQKAWDPQTGDLVGSTIEEQTALIFDNIEKILDGLGLTLKNTVRLSCFLSEVGQYPIFNEVYETCLGGHKPCRTVLSGLSLRDGALLEIVAEAYRTPS